MAKTNKPPRLSKTEMASILEQATADFAKALDIEGEAGQRLAKADPGHEAPGEENPEGSSSAPPAPEASAPPEATDAPPAPPAEGTPADGASPPADPAAAAGQGGEVTVEQIKAEFDQLDVEELKKYFVAAKAALMEKMGGAGGAPEGASPDAGASPAPGPEASASPPPASPSPAASPSPSPEKPPMGKGEFDDQSGKVKEGSMHKSEKQMDEILGRLSKAEEAVGQVAELKKALADRDATIAIFEEKMGQVAAGVQKIVQKTGLRKSIPTEAAAAKIVGKPGSAPAGAARDPKTLTKSEAVAKLNIVTRDPKLAKSDRDIINKFVAGTAPIDTVVKFLG